MHLSIVTLIALAAMTTAAPHTPSNSISIPIFKRSSLTSKNVVDVKALKAHVNFVKAKIRLGLETYKKNTGETHPSALQRVKKRGNGTGDPLTDFQNDMWYGSIQVGTPPQKFTVDFDTGSADLIVPDFHCKSCNGHNLYKPHSSSTSRSTNRTYTIEYGDGSSVFGNQFNDTVSLAGFKATQQDFLAASTYSISLQSDSGFPADGIIGLAFQSISVQHKKSVFGTLVDQHKVPTSSFSFKLAESGAELYVGGANHAQYKGDFAYAPVTAKGYWQVDMNGLRAHGKTLLGKTPAIIDTGTTLVIGLASEVAKIYRVLGGKDASEDVGEGYYTFECDKFPEISLGFGDVWFPISNTTLNLGMDPADVSRCVSGLAGADTDASFWVVGDVFLQNTYTKFDYGSRRVGFAHLA